MAEPRIPLALQTRLDDLALEGAFVRPTSRPRLAFSRFPSGLVQGVLTHLDGPARTEAVVALLAEHPGVPAAWVEARLTAYPPGFVQRGVDLACLLFVEGHEHFSWAVTELVRSQAFQVVVVASPLPDAMALRRLQLAAERAATAVLLAAPLPGEAWPVRARWWCDWQEGRVVVADAADKAADTAAVV